MSDLTGELLDGRYEIGAILARGGMATVYSALDTRLDRLVAVKVMHPHLANDDDFVERFIREAKAAASLTHPNVVAVHDQGWNQGGTPAVYLVMEFVDGPTLREVIRDRPPLSLDATLVITEAILGALDAAHRAGIVHRDVKPENVIVANDGRIKVADFGLARALSSASTITADAGTLLGTVAYLSPEQVQRGIADARSDVYAVGIMLFEMLVGSQPFVGETPLQVAFRHVNEEVPAPSSLRLGIPASIDALVAHATASDPDQRPKDANDFLREVQSAHSELDPLDSSRHEKEQPREMTKKNERESARPAARNVVANQKRKSRRWLFLIAALILGAFFWYLSIGPGAGVSVPSLVGLSTQDATADVTKLGLKLVVSAQTFNEEIPADRVISSNPAGGGRIKDGGTVTVEISKGPERYLVPKLISLSIAQATTLLTPLHLSLDTPNQVYSDTVPKGHILSTQPIAGSKVPRDTVISATVSKGVAPVALVSYVGKGSDQALTELTAAGLKPVSKMAYSDTVAAGVVISQSPAGGGNVAKGTVVTLIVSKGPRTVKVPNVVGMLAADAGKTIEDAGFTFTINKLSTRGNGRVVGETPAAGTLARAGSLVILDVY